MASKKHIGYWLALFATIALVILYATRRDLPGLYEDYLASKDQVSALESRADALDAEVAQLEKRVHNLGSDPLEVEAAIRRGQNLIREGETVYRIELPDEAGE